MKEERIIAHDAMTEARPDASTARNETDAGPPPLDLAAIIDVKAIQALMDDFHSLTRIGVAILDLEGKVLVATGWQDICVKFHRVHPDSLENCLESDLKLSNGVAPGTFKRYRCKNGMWDMATPIVVGDRKVGNLYLGQFLFEDESPDVDAFRRRARKFGFDEDAYIAALERVPRWSRRTVDTVMTFYARLAALISDLGYTNLMLARNLTEKNRLLASLGESELKYRDLVENLNDLIYTVDTEGRITYLSPAVTAIFGYDPAELLGRPYESVVHVEDHETVAKAFAKVLKGELAPTEYRVLARNGAVRWVRTSSRPIPKGGRVVGIQGILTDITERVRMEKDLAAGNKYLRMAQRIAKIGNWSLDPQIGVPVWSDEVYRIYERDPALGPHSLADYRNIYHGKWWDIFNTAVTKAIREGIPYDTQLKLELPSGVVKWVHAICEPDREPGPEGHILRGTIQDITERKRIEENIRESETKFNTAFHAGPVAMSITTFDEGVFLEVNEPFLRLMALEREAVIGKKAVDLGMWGDLDRQELLSEMERNGFLHNMEVELINKAGRRIPLLWFGDLVRIRGKRCIIASGFDLTALKTAENALRESEARHRSILETAVDGFCMVDTRGRLREVNDAYCRMSGYTKAELLTMRLWDLEYDETRAQIDTHIRELMKTEQGRFETRHRRKDGSIFDAEVSVQYRAGDTPCFIAFVRDITGPKKAAAERKKLQTQLANALDMAQLGHWEYDVAADQFTFNDHFYNIFRTTADAVGGYTMSPAEYAERFVHPEDRSIVATEIQKALATDDPSYSKQLEHRMLYADGGVGHISVRFFIVKDDKGNTIRTYGVNQDITERKQLEERVRQIQKMESIGTLAGGIAHDFNNILSPIIGFSELLMEDLSPESLEHENTREIMKAGIRGKELVKQILAFSRQTEHRPVPVCLRGIVKEVLKMSRSMIPSNIKISQDLPTDRALVMADATQLHQVVMNLVTNAYHAVEKKGGTILVRLRKVASDVVTPDRIMPDANGYALLSVSDTGTGIDPSVMDKLFEPYFTTKEQGKGTGLGLAVVYGIVSEHKGEIRVASELGKGSTFDVYLPLMRTADEMESHQEPHPPETGTERVLVVDDESSVVHIETLMLQRLGYRVSAFTSSTAALAAFRKTPLAFDLVLTDMTMPELTGDVLAEKLSAIRPDIPIIICTGFSERLDKETAAKRGIGGFLMKPLVKSELARTVRRVLEDQSRTRMHPVEAKGPLDG